MSSDIFNQENVIFELVEIYDKHHKNKIETSYYFEAGDEYSVKRKNITSKNTDIYVELPLTRNGVRRFVNSLRNTIKKDKSRTTNYYLNHG